MSIPTVQTTPFWWIVPGALLSTQYQQSQAAQPHAAAYSLDDELPRITDRASGSHLPSIVRHNDGVWSEVNLNLN